MEQIYPPEGFNASERVNLKDYFQQFAESVPAVNEETDDVTYLLKIKELMGVEMSFNDLKHLSEACSIEHLTCPQENREEFPMKVPDNLNSVMKLPSKFVDTNGQNNLATYKCKQELEAEKDSTQLCIGNKRKYIRMIEYPMPETVATLKSGLDFIVSVLVYKPIKLQFDNNRNASEKLRFNHEIVALGRSTLAELRDTIICHSDFGVCKEVESTTCDLTQMDDAKGKYPSGFLFIENVFYNDFRADNAIDYSAPIIDWCKDNNIENLQCENIDDVTIDSLTLRFGYPYLYMHQGDCEHLLVFADARLLSADDCLHMNIYPHVTKLIRANNKRCLLCYISLAKWICVGSDRLPQDKVFLCTECCNAYNFLDGKKIGNFRLYPFYGTRVAM